MFLILIICYNFCNFQGSKLMLFKVLPHIIIWCALFSKRAAIEKKEKELHATNKKKLYV